jgi:folate-binding protein YgfZ
MLSPTPFPFKTSDAAAASFALPDWSLLSVDGPDSGAFLHAQFTSDVRALGDGQWHWSAWLNAKGRVIAVFALLRVDAQAFRLFVPDLPAPELAAALQRFVFRSKVRLSVEPGWSVAGVFAPLPDGVAPDRALGDATQGWWLHVGTPAEARWLRSLPGVAARDPAAEAAWFDADLRHGLPRLPPSQREAWTPQMLGLPRLRALSLTKGCYPGQEIVARTHYLGQAKRGPVLLSGEHLLAGATVEADGAAAGTLACASADGRLGIAVLALDRARSPLAVGGRPASAESFDDGLQRPV